jgi:hypothetical protein
MNGGICQVAHNFYTIGYDASSKKILMMGDNKANIREKIHWWQEFERWKVQDEYGRLPAWFHGGDYVTVCFGFLNTNESEN